MVAEVVLKIPLSPFSHAGKWIWSEEKNRNSSVRSAYRVIQMSMLPPLGECFTPQNSLASMESSLKNASLTQNSLICVACMHG